VSEHLDFSALNAEWDAARRRPCAGECGRLYVSGGTLYLNPSRWYCTGCDARINGPVVDAPPEGK
jgi:hypothetical protein